MQRADLPPELQRRVLAELDPPARLALFRCSRTLARTVVLHAPSAKRLTKLDSGSWAPALAGLLDGPQLQPLADLELRVEGGADLEPSPPPPPPSPPFITHHVARLHLSCLTLTPLSLAAWRLHDAALWPHLQHLILHECPIKQPPAAAPAQPLQPIPRLLTFSWQVTRDDGGNDGTASQAAVLPLAAQARRLRVTASRLWEYDRSREMSLKALACLPHLTHADLDAAGFPSVAEALLRLPMLEHVTLITLHLGVPDHSQHACRWRTLTVHSWADLGALACLPLDNLERLTLKGLLGGGPMEQQQAGLAVLQRLHSQGRLALRRTGLQDRRWQLSPADGMFLMLQMGSLAPAVLRLLLEAGQGINTLYVDRAFLAPATLQQQVAPLLREHAGRRITTLCMSLDFLHNDEEWWGRVLGRLPASITHLKVDVLIRDEEVVEDCLLALMEGSIGMLQHPLTLTVLHKGQVDADLEGELMVLAHESLITLAVVDTVDTEEEE